MFLSSPSFYNSDRILGHVVYDQIIAADSGSKRSSVVGGSFTCLYLINYFVQKTN